MIVGSHLVSVRLLNRLFGLTALPQRVVAIIRQRAWAEVTQAEIVLLCAPLEVTEVYLPLRGDIGYVKRDGAHRLHRL